MLTFGHKPQHPVKMPIKRASCYFTVMFFLHIFILAIVNAEITVFNHHNKVVDIFKDAELIVNRNMVPDIRGIIVSADPLDACLPIQKPYSTNHSLAKFVLIFGNKSRECSLHKKVSNADEAGYDVAVLFDVEPFSEKIYDPGINVIAVTVDNITGLTIMDNYLYSNRSAESERYWIKLTPTTAFLALYIIVLMVIVFFCSFVAYELLGCCIKRSCYWIMDFLRRKQRIKKIKQQIKRLTKERFSIGDRYDTCVICLEEYKEGDKLRKLPCFHTYHAGCFDQLLLMNYQTCPICNQKIECDVWDSESNSSASRSESSSGREHSPLVRSMQSFASRTPEHRRRLAEIANDILTRACIDLAVGSSSSSHSVQEERTRHSSQLASANEESTNVADHVSRNSEFVHSVDSNGNDVIVDR